VITADTSVVAAAFSPWNALHGPAARSLKAITERPLIGHVALETVSTLSRMPERHRIAPGEALAALKQTFQEPWIALDGLQAGEGLERAIAAGITGGALHDALIASTASVFGLRLLTADRRARPTYEALGADVIFVG